MLLAAVQLQDNLKKLFIALTFRHPSLFLALKMFKTLTIYENADRCFNIQRGIRFIQNHPIKQELHRSIPLSLISYAFSGSCTVASPPICSFI